MTQQTTTPLKRFLFYLNTAGCKLFCSTLSHALRGEQHLPSGPYLIAANHRSLIDGLIVVNEFNRVRGRAMHMIAYQEPFAHPLLGPMLRLSGCLPFDRGSAESRMEILQTAIAYLRAGEPVGIFPEAHLSTTGKMRRARPGMALIALEAGVPIVPVGLQGTERVWPPGGGRLRLGRQATITAGKPIDTQNWQERFQCGSPQERNEVIEELSTTVMQRIADLSGQDYPEPRRRSRLRTQGERHG